MHFSIFIVQLILLTIYQPTRAETKYSIEIQSFEPNTMGTGIFDPKTLRVSRKGRNTFVISGDFSLNMNLGVDSMVMYDVSKKMDVSDKYFTVMKGGGNVCSFCATNTNFYPRFRTFTNFPDRNTCPFPKGNYTIKDYTIDEKLIPENIPNGIYIVKTMFSKNNQNIFGYTTTIVIGD